MPDIAITLVKGYDEEFRRQLSAKITDTVRMFTGAPPDSVTVVINEVDYSSYRQGQLSRSPGPPATPPSQIVLSYLAAMEERDLEKAQSFLAEDFAMTFPGDAHFASLEDLVAWSKDRYKFVRKTIDSVHEVAEKEGAMVYCTGTLAGEWPDGSHFSGIRFIDSFAVRDGKLAEQKVWNDLAEAHALPKRKRNSEN